jgi:hypothetical protein
LVLGGTKDNKSKPKIGLSVQTAVTVLTPFSNDFRCFQAVSLMTICNTLTQARGRHTVKNCNTVARLLLARYFKQILTACPKMSPLSPPSSSSASSTSSSSSSASYITATTTTIPKLNPPWLAIQRY